MADEQTEETNPTEERIKDLSGKVKATATERDEALKAKAEAEDKAAAAEKRAVFAEQFSDIVVSNPAAKEFKAEIEAKVLSGQTPEDAMYAVLGKAGKLGTPAPTPPNPAGGSASTSINNPSVTKPVAEMTLDEKRAKLSEEMVWT